MEIEDLKRKVERLTEKVNKNTQDITPLTPVLVDAMKNQIYCGGDIASQIWLLMTAMMKQLSLLLKCKNILDSPKGATRRKIEELRQVIMALEDRVNILRRSRDDIWLVSDRLTNEVDRVSATLSDRLAGIERQMQSQSATPATISDQNPVGQEEFAQLESRTKTRFQAFTNDVDLLSKCGRSPQIWQTHKSHQKHCCDTDETPLTVVFREANLWGQVPSCAAKFACQNWKIPHFGAQTAN